VGRDDEDFGHGVFLIFQVEGTTDYSMRRLESQPVATDEHIGILDVHQFAAAWEQRGWTPAIRGRGGDGRAIFAKHSHGGVDCLHIVGRSDESECEKMDRAAIAKEYLQQKG